MGFDAVTRRYSLVILGGLVALAAYFQARGIGSLVSGHLVPEKGPSFAAMKPANVGATTTTKSGKDILSRNPFDSVTGPLDGSTLVPDEAKKPAAVTMPGNDPYMDPACAGVSSSLITATEDKAWSFASISVDGDDKLRRIGDKAGQFTVQHIGYYESENHDIQPRVWLAKESSRCIVEMGAAPPASAKPSIGTTESTKRPTSKRAKLEADVKSKITKLGENEFEVDKSGVELIIQNYAKLASSVRGKAGKEGMKLTGIRDNSILGELGMKTGDVLTSINGFDMSDPDKALDAYAKLRRAGSLEIAYQREGAPSTVKVKIK